MDKRFVCWGLAMAVAVVLSASGARAAEWSGSVGTVTSKDVVIVMEFMDRDPPKGAQVQVYESPRGKPNRLICLGVVKSVSGRAVIAVMQPCSAPIRPGLRVIITTRPKGQESSGCQNLSGTLECRVTYVLDMGDGRVEVKSHGAIPFAATDQAPYPLRGQGTMRTATAGRSEESRLMGPSTGTFNLKGSCGGKSVTFILTSAMTQTGAWVGSNPRGSVSVGPSTQGGGGSQTVTLELKDGATATVPISGGGGSGHSVYTLRLGKR